MSEAATAPYDWYGLNTEIFLAINQYHAPAFDRLMLALDVLAHPRLFPVYIAAMLWMAWRAPGTLPMRNVVCFATGYLLVSMTAVPVLKYWLDQPRPLTALGAERVTVLGTPDALHSFPSGHAAFAVLLAASLIPGSARSVQIAMIAFALLVCFSRISTGAHFPLDVLAGAGLAFVIVTVLRRLLPAGGKR